ncbi:hypothetical protein NDU88_009462 [Pleurodeles waltl]|uniref:Uncharacterized protein n=1 Tax=Pleurodeles waltl TaxID=8319 RepID=A0AAV7PW05_PLEWA|nr:hypothetical protein NDU88_009462 [Pleurodeles waltl]
MEPAEWEETSDRAPRRAACQHGRCPRVSWGPLRWAADPERSLADSGGGPRQATSGTEASGGPTGGGGVRRPGLLGDVIYGALRCAVHQLGWRLLGPAGWECGTATCRSEAEANRGCRWWPLRPNWTPRRDRAGPLITSRARERPEGCSGKTPEPCWTEGRAKWA